MALPPDRNEAISLLRDLVSIDTCQPAGNEAEAVKYIASLFENKPVEVKIMEHGANRASMIVKIAGRREDKGIMFVSHLDTVPTGDVALWRFPPHAGHMKEGWLHGRGATDMKGGVTATILAALHVLQFPSPPPVDLCFAFTADEEHAGVGALALSHEKDFIGSVDELIVPEPTDLAVAVAEKGTLWLKVRAIGRSAHASMPESGVNAVEALVSFVASLKDEFHLFTKSIPPHALLNQTTCTLTRCHGGVSTNIIPSHCEASFDFRTLPGMEENDLLALTDRVARTLESSMKGLSIEIEVLNNRHAVECRADAPILSRLEKSFAKIGMEMKKIGVHYYTDAAQIVPAFGIKQFSIVGPGCAADCHKIDEAVCIDSVVEAEALFCDFIYSKR
jgi:succinyl-diaminopimelate desuccinylase